MRQLPLWGRVVFVDWHGVLSRDPFWTSIREGAQHPLRGQLEAGLAGVFAKDRATANEWMKGLLSSDQIIATMGIQLDRRFRDDFLPRRLDVDCARMKVNVGLFELLRRVKAQASVVLATDNMDCFVRTFDQARARARRLKPESETLADWAMICDDIICSSEVGALKAEDPEGFFGPWLKAHGLKFSDAALIDDRADNCAAFTGQGGTPIQYKMATNEVTEVVELLNQWFARTS
jgi:FMN phosphatase YigB (HAD superfamily)